MLGRQPLTLPAPAALLCWARRSSSGRALGGYPTADLRAGAFSITAQDGGPAPGPAAWTRKTKLVCTIGPATCSREKLFELADAGARARAGHACALLARTCA